MTKFDQETLVKLATQTEKALTDKTLSAISNLSPDVVLHQDAFTLNHDIKGAEEVKKYLQAYFDKYEYEHDTLGYGVNPDSSCSFALSYDKGVHLKNKGDLPKEAVEPVATIGVWKQVYNSDGKVTDIYFYRQMSADELHSKVKDPSKAAHAADEDLKELVEFRGLEMKKDPWTEAKCSPERFEKLLKAAKSFSAVWQDGKTELAKDVLAEDVVSKDLLFGNVITGFDNWSKMVHGIFENWEQNNEMSDYAVSYCGSKAFIHWSNKGKESKTGKENNLKGMSVLVFGHNDKAVRVLSFRQPLASERSQVMKEE
ncbi:hypothetical protein ABBQ38_005758 [Trebouxia sp. C0009 RCD-2024]